MVAGPKRGDSGADRLHDADAFVAEDAAWSAGRHVAFQDVQVRAADGGLDHFHDRVAGRQEVRLGPIFKRLGAGSVVDEGFHGTLLDS